jgi:hypothetical protein
MVAKIELFEYANLTPLHYFVGLQEGGSLQHEVDTLTNCWLKKRKNVKISSDEQHAIFAHELQSALRLTVGFSNIYCEL